jgi:hypothetical protein
MSVSINWGERRIGDDLVGNLGRNESEKCPALSRFESAQNDAGPWEDARQ